MRPADAEMLAVARDATAPDETVLWRGRPIVRPLARQAIPVICLALVPALLIALSHAARAAAAEAGPWRAFVAIAPLTCLPALIVMALHRRDRARTLYLVTDRRILIVRAAWRRSLTTLDRPGRNAVTYMPRSLTEGTIHISRGMCDDGEGGVEERFLDLGAIADYRHPLSILLR